MQTLIIIIQILIASLKRERMFVLVLRLDKQRSISKIKRMSLGTVHDGMHATLNFMAERERIDYTPQERAEFGIPDDVHYTGGK